MGARESKPRSSQEYIEKTELKIHQEAENQTESELRPNPNVERVILKDEEDGKLKDQGKTHLDQSTQTHPPEQTRSSKECQTNEQEPSRDAGRRTHQLQAITRAQKTLERALAILSALDRKKKIANFGSSEIKADEAPRINNKTPEKGAQVKKEKTIQEEVQKLSAEHPEEKKEEVQGSTFDAETVGQAKTYDGASLTSRPPDVPEPDGRNCEDNTYDADNEKVIPQKISEEKSSADESQFHESVQKLPNVVQMFTEEPQCPHEEQNENIQSDCLSLSLADPEKQSTKCSVENDSLLAGTNIQENPEPVTLINTEPIKDWQQDEWQSSSSTEYEQGYEELESSATTSEEERQKDVKSCPKVLEDEQQGSQEPDDVSGVMLPDLAPTGWLLKTLTAEGRGEEDKADLCVELNRLEKPHQEKVAKKIFLKNWLSKRLRPSYLKKK